MFLTQPVRSLGAGPHNWRCRARVFSLAARIETSQGEVCREYGTNYVSVRPLADFSPARVAQGDNFREGEETLVLAPVYERCSVTIEIGEFLLGLKVIQYQKLTVENTRLFAVLSADLIANNVRTTASTFVEWLP